jgi:hypothetical protein
MFLERSAVMKGLCVLAAMLWCGLACAEDYLVTPKGIWRIVDGEPVRMTTDSDRIHFAGDPGDVTPNPPPTPDPPTGDLVEEVEKISKKLLQNEQEATGVIAVVRLFLRDDVNPDMIEEGLDRSILIIKSHPIYPGNRIGDWWDEIKDLDQEFDQSFVASIEEGLRKAFDLPKGSMETREDVAKLDLVDLIELIKMILEILKDLGIFNRSAEFAAATIVDPSFIHYESLLASLAQMHEEVPAWMR